MAVARGLDGQMSGGAWSPDLNNMREGERNATNGLCKPAQPETLMICVSHYASFASPIA
jgi:hypothetical protein